MRTKLRQTYLNNGFRFNSAGCECNDSYVRVLSNYRILIKHSRCRGTQRSTRCPVNITVFDKNGMIEVKQETSEENFLELLNRILELDRL